jgi:hypothetical protein
MNKFTYWLRYSVLENLAEILLITFLLFIVFGLYPLMKYSNTYECEQYQEITGRQTKIVGLNCYIKYEGEWYKSGEIKVIRK